MSRSNDSLRSQRFVTQMDRMEKDMPKVRIGLPGIAWAGLSLFVILLTLLLLLLMDGRNVVHAAPKARPWSAAMVAGNWAEVQKLAKAAVDKNPRDDEAQNALGRAYIELGKLQEAEIPLITAESLGPGNADYKIDLAELYARRGVSSLAAGKYREALDLDPSLVSIHWRLARALYVLKDYDASLEELRIINQLEPENWDAYRLTADVAMGRRKYDEAIRNLKLYTSVVPDARAYAKLAFAYMSLETPDTASARDAAQTALSIDPGDSQAHLALARINLIRLSQKGLAKPAMQQYADQALQHYTQTANFLVGARDAGFMARLYGTKQDLAGAERSLRIAAAVDSANKDYAFDLASNLMAQQKYDDARKIYDNVIALEPTNPSAWVNKGMAEHQAGDPDAAIKAYQKAIEVNENFAPAYKNMGDVKKDKGANAEAKDNYRLAMDRAGTDAKTGAEAGDALGYMLLQEGDYAGAVSALERALTFDQCHLHALLTLASAYQKLNQMDKVCATMSRARTCAPGEPTVRQALAGYGCK